MDAALRKAFNASFDDERYQALLRHLDEEVGRHVPFRISETPIFLTAELTAALVEAAHDVLRQVTEPEYLAAAAARAVPAELSVPGEGGHPVCVQIDFALAAAPAGQVVPQLIELQAFPSLYAFQWLLDRMYREHYALPRELTPYFGGLDRESYVERLREAILGGCDPEQVVLLEIEPEEQKTRPDFAATEKLLGVRPVCVTEVAERGGRLFYRRDGREVPIARLYNRVIFDELLRRGLPLEPIFRRELDVSWVGHPNWYFKISKFSLPFLTGRYCPPARFVSDVLAEVPADLGDYVLKPLYSFAGVGVEMDVTADRLRAIERPEEWILQRKVEYAPAIESPDGPAKAEIRMMFLWTDRPRLVNNLVRMSKGKMMGVDFNKEKTWVGASVAYHRAG